MTRIGKVVFVTMALIGLGLALAPAAHACCRPCQGYCDQKGVPPTAVCCSGIPTPEDACGFTTCGKWLQGQRADFLSFTEAAPLTPAGEASCEQAFPWLAAL